MLISKDTAMLLAVIGAGLVVVALGMLTWTGAAEGVDVWGYAAALVTGTAGGSCLVIAIWWWWKAVQSNRARPRAQSRKD